jgi:hypothetical protein
MLQKTILVTLLLLLSFSPLGAQVTIPNELFTPDKINVVVFLSVDCPISQKYMGTLNELVKERADQVVILGIIPGKIKKADVRKFSQEYQAAFKIISDPHFQWTDRFQAGFTPEVFTFNGQREFIYQGAVDNWFFDLGNYRQQITENYLRDIIAAELEGKNPPFKKTETVGCIIQKPVKRQ